MDKPRAATSRRLMAVVVTHNRLRHLQTTMARLLDTPTEQLYRLVVVDNNSTDGTLDWLETQTDPRLDILRLSRNLGGAGGFEAGMRHAVATHDPDWIVVMDDDSRPVPGALAVFHGADVSSWDAVAAAVYFPDGTICDINRPSRNPFWHPAILRSTVLSVISGGLLGTARDAFHLGAADYAASEPSAVDGVSFVGLFLSRGAVRKAGFPDGRLFIYGDDVLYTLGLRALGGRIAFWPQIRFEHDFSTIHAAERRFRPLWKSYYHYRNLLMVYRRAAGGFFWPVLLVVIPKWFLKIRYHPGVRGKFLRLLGVAIQDGLLGRTSRSHADILAMSKE